MRFSFEHGSLDGNEYNSLAEKASYYISRLSAIAGSGEYAEPESPICLPSDGSIADGVSVILGEKIKSPLKCVAVVGIGGSNLGTKAVYDAILGYKDSSRGDSRPKMVFFDTVDGETAKANIDFIFKTVREAEELLVVIISKSGVTVETIAQAEYLLGELSSKFTGVEERTIVITDEGSPLFAAAEERNMAVITIPKYVGGRYGVFSATGLLPLMAGGFDTKEFLSGALEMRDLCLSPEAENNPALKSAAFLAHWHNRGKSIHDSFYFNPGLESLGKWHRQLLSESIGKSEKIGITPTVSIGSTDLHSAGQLYLGGPKDKTSLFVASGAENSAGVPKDRFFRSLVPSLDGKSFGEIMWAILSGTKTAYQKNGVPFMEAELSGIAERELGAFMSWKIIETMILGEMLGVNAFDQPAVESYKKETERILNNE